MWSLIIFLPVCLITAINPVVSVLCLVGTATLLAIYWFITGLTFVSMLYVLVYVGAVAILFLFVIMTLDVRELELVDNKWSRQLFIAAFFLIALLLGVEELVLFVFEPVSSYVFFEETANLVVLGTALYGSNTLNLLIIVLVLLASIITPLLICLK